MNRIRRFAVLAVYWGIAIAAFAGSWAVWRLTGLPCTAETALLLHCNPSAELSHWIRLDAIQQCGINTGIALALVGGNDGMFFLQERQERKRETARADRAEAAAEQAKVAAEQAKSAAEEAKAAAEKMSDVAGVRQWLQSLTDEQKDAIYAGPTTIGGVFWARINGEDYFGRRNSDGTLLMDSFPGLQPD